ncbi:MAG: cytochrome c4 [Alphaproteobacteria bacterium]|nr:cytochrome c4 [Alphaproteobacteria bacterium]
MKRITVALLAGAAVLGTQANAAPKVPREPRTVVQVCSQCHGDRGLSTSPLFPNLAAQNKQYLVTQLKDFRDHKRGDPHAQAYMWGMAGRLTDSVIERVATYFSALPAPPGDKTQNAAELAAGKEIFEKGIASEQVPACAACHGATGAGSATIPRLAGQHREYLATQLLAFRDNERRNNIMHANVVHITDQQIRDISAYLASL